MREQLWDNSALWESFWTSAAVSSRPGSMLAWIIKMKFLNREPLITSYSCFRGTDTFPRTSFQARPLNLWSTLAHTESKPGIAAILFWLLSLPFEKSPSQNWSFRQVSVKNVISSKNIILPASDSQNRDLRTKYCACSTLCSVLSMLRRGEAKANILSKWMLLDWETSLRQVELIQSACSFVSFILSRFQWKLFIFLTLPILKKLIDEDMNILPSKHHHDLVRCAIQQRFLGF